MFKTTFSTPQDDILTRAIDNGCAFNFNIAASQIPAGGAILYRFNTLDLPEFVYSRILKSTVERAEYEVYVEPVLTGTITEVPLEPRWLNGIVNPGRLPKMTCHRLDGAVFVSGTQIVGDISGAPEMDARRILDYYTEFYVLLKNTTGGNTVSSFQLIMIELLDSKYPPAPPVAP